TPSLRHTTSPASVTQRFSGEVEGKVTRCPSALSCSRHSAKATASRRAGKRSAAISSSVRPEKEASESSSRSSHSPPIGQVDQDGSPRTGSVYPHGSELWCTVQPSAP